MQAKTKRVWAPIAKKEGRAEEECGQRGCVSKCREVRNSVECVESRESWSGWSVKHRGRRGKKEMEVPTGHAMGLNARSWHLDVTW